MSSKAALMKFNKNLIKERWLELQKIPNIFAYSLNVRRQRIVPGNCKFYVEYNPERSSLRRLPQIITSLNPKYDDSCFNFNKVDPRERIVTIPFNGADVVFIINKSPLTKYHTLICPDLEGCHGQRVTLDGLRFCIIFLQNLNEKEFRIGYNSPLALASVNHLHFHLMYVENELYIDKVELEPLAERYIYRLQKDMPTQAICWFINACDSEEDFNTKLAEIYNFLMWLCEQNRPHNIFMTPVSSDDGLCLNAIKIFIFVREKPCTMKDLKMFNIGFCEFAGYLPVGNPDVYDSLTEEFIIEKLRNETGCMYDEIYKYFEKWNTN